MQSRITAGHSPDSELGPDTQVSGTSAPVGCQNSATRSELGFLCGWLVLVEQAAPDGSAGDLLDWCSGDRVLGSWWSWLTGPVRAVAVVVPGVLGQHTP